MVMLPVNGGRISSGYKAKEAFRKEEHTGVDYALPEDSPVRASASGTIIRCVNIPKNPAKTGYGNMVEIDHGNGYTTIYGHLKEVRITKGSVNEGDIIGTVGDTGHATGFHLHFEVRENGTPINPNVFLANASSKGGGGGNIIDTIISNNTFQAAANSLGPALESNSNAVANRLLSYGHWYGGLVRGYYNVVEKIKR